MDASEDRRWMKHALALARRGEGGTAPNPPVGAVIVRRGRRVGAGYHRIAGGPHAEVAALAAAGRSASGATLYVSLEPCCTTGRTGPCTTAILQAGIRRVVMAVRDPNPAHNGRGVGVLKRAGMAVTESVLAEAGAELIAPFATRLRTGRPYVSLKMAMTLDGRIADAHGRSRWITGEKARQLVHAWRRRSDAVMVGRRTAQLDDPSLLATGTGAGAAAWRVIVDTAGKLPLTAKVLNDENAERTLIATTTQCSELKRRRYEAKGATVWALPTARGRVSVRSLLRRLGNMGLLRVLCEGGGALAFELARSDVIDEYLFFVAPILLGDRAVPVVRGDGWRLTVAPRLRFVECRAVGEDRLLRAVPARSDEGEGATASCLPD